ncbi:ABC-type transport system substrate-binding protein [Thermocatellispora tengchongensis]|uniref:ABC-type transport system substrate-binding protein n=1 Tax=Thermocatellispora tengchongensis TaxID=1073253 RepID=A0A840PTL8_9ACTN|nr:ABC transporter substrate-binding protein [Thermocatellispora tengchongensis]MBB5139265.1 ABC-type transport system substrate-binding protein [Thermocatellispora tengchongensis]
MNLSWKRRRTLLGAALAAALTLSACGSGGGGDDGKAAPAGRPQAGGTLVLQLPSEVTRGLNPLTSSDPTLMGLLSGTVYSKLVDVKTGPDTRSLEIVPDLAESWEISKDGLTYTFKLRDDVRWHDIPPVNGRPFTSDDVVATFEGLKKATMVHQWMIEPVRVIEAPDEHTVVFKLKRPYSPLLDYLAYHFNMILPREGVEGEFDLKTKAIGTGPFMLDRHTPDVEWVLKKNPDYFIPGRPYLDEIRRPIMTDIAAVTAALRSGRVDVGTTSDVNVAKQLESKGFQVSETPGAPVSIYINPKVEPFDDVRVRQAVVRAVDWAGMGENIRGRYNLTSMLRPDITPAALPREEVMRLRPYDPQGAKALLAQAGLPNGFTTKLMVQRVDDEDVREAQWIQDDLAKIGVKMEIEMVDPGTGIERRRNHDFAMAKALRGVHLPDQVWRDFEPQSLENYTQVDDAELNRLLERSRAELDEDKRNEIYRQMQVRMETQIVQAVYPIQKFDYSISRDRVRDLWPSPIYQGRRLADVWLSDS